MKRVLCWFKAIGHFIRFRKWELHNYEETVEKAIIITDRNKRKFRVSDNYKTKSWDEVVYDNADLMILKCKCCGKEKLSWYADESHRVQVWG